MKKALITGITGQDGSYLVELLLKKGYEVHGIMRRSSSINTWRLEHLINNLEIYNIKLFLHYGDMADITSLVSLIKKADPDEIYNLAAQSHVKVSFEIPIVTAETDALGTLKILEAIRILEKDKKVKFYQASTSELFGGISALPLDENSPFYPRSPYAVAKLYAYWIVKHYREAYGLFACNGILFNHESERRGITFVTRKITLGLAKIKCGNANVLELGNLDAKRDWGYAPEYVEAMWLMLQEESPTDMIIATGETHTIREFVDEAAKEMGFNIKWKGKGINEVGVDAKTDKVIIRINPKYFRPAEVDCLIGNPTNAEKVLGWKARIKFSDLVKRMVKSDLEMIKINKLVF